jgi:hypothetical protein
MKSRKLAIVIVGSLVFLFGVTFAAWAGGGAAGQYACCVADNPASSYAALTGTVTVVYSPPEGTCPSEECIPAYIDVKLRLERGSKIGFFELHLNENVMYWTNYEIMCLILNPNEPKPSGYPTGDLASIAAVANLVDQILGTFFPKGGLDHTNASLVLTRKSITLTDGGTTDTIPTTDRIAAMGDVVVYVINPASVRWEYNPQCPPSSR